MRAREEEEDEEEGRKKRNRQALSCGECKRRKVSGGSGEEEDRTDAREGRSSAIGTFPVRAVSEGVHLKVAAGTTPRLIQRRTLPSPPLHS